MTYYSQFEQDKFVYENYFKNKFDGYFVDIGAHDGITFSNSKFFEEIGWTGICVEPNPKIFKKLQLNRTNKCIMKAISNNTEKAQFFQILNGPDMLSGLVEDFTQSSIKRINQELNSNEEKYEYDYIEVDCDTFDNIVNQTKINFLSLDTEGNEMKILQNIDFEKFDIDVITVENNDYDSKFINFLLPKGYKFITRLGCDELYKK